MEGGIADGCWGEGGGGRLDEGLKASTEGTWVTSGEEVVDDGRWEERLLSAERSAGGKMDSDRVRLSCTADWRV